MHRHARLVEAIKNGADPIRTGIALDRERSPSETVAALLSETVAALLSEPKK